MGEQADFEIDREMDAYPDWSLFSNSSAKVYRKLYPQHWWFPAIDPTDFDLLEDKRNEFTNTKRR